MPQLIEAEGKIFEFPDNATQEQISASLVALRGEKEDSGLARRFIADPAISLVKGAVGVPETVIGLTDIVTGGYTGKFAESLGFRPKEAKKYLDTLLSAEQQAANKALEEADGFVDTVVTAVSNPSTILHGALESLPSVGSGGVVARQVLKQAPKLGALAAGAIGEGVVSGSQTAEQIRQETESGLTTFGQSALAAGSGTVTGLFGVGGGKFSQKLGLTDIDTLLAGGKLTGAKKGAFKSLLGGMLSEGVFEELPQSAQEQIAQNLALDKPWTEGIDKAAAMGMLTGALMGGGVSAYGSLTSIGDDNVSLPAPTIPPTVPPPVLFEHPTVDTPIEPDVQAFIDNLDATLIDDTQVTEAMATVAKFKEQQKAPALPEAKAAWGGALDKNAELDTGELGASRDQAANAVNYPNPNTGDRWQTPVLLGPEGAVGLTLEQQLPQKSTYVIGAPTLDRSLEVLTAYRDTLETWRQKYTPDATFIISNEQLPFNNAIGWHYSENGIHVVVPAVLRNPHKGWGAFNANTQVSAFYNLSHEFGHGLLDERLFEGVDPLARQTLMQEVQTGLISEQTTAQLPEAVAALAREYNAVKSSILAGEMNAGEFVNQWMGPGKAGRINILEGVDPLAPATTLLNKIASEAIKSIEERKSREEGKAWRMPETARNRLRADIVSDLMNFNEYFAEQTARYAYKAKWDQTSALGKLFKQALDSLRAFFIEAKRDTIITPGTAFTKWVEGLTKTEQLVNGKEQQEIAKKSKKKVEAKPKAVKKEKKVKVERLQNNVETDTHEQKLTEGQNLIFSLFESKQLAVGSPDAVKMLQLLKQKDYDEFIDLYKKYSGKKVSFEIKAPGGQWHPDTIDTLAEILYASLQHNTGAFYTKARDKIQYTTVFEQQNAAWARKAVKNYLHKYAGTKTDPLNDIPVLMLGEDARWEDLTDKVFTSRKTLQVIKRPFQDYYRESLYNNNLELAFANTPPEEPIWLLRSLSRAETLESHYAQRSMQDFLAHVGDYLFQNVKPEKLQQYDLVRAVKETSANDARVAKLMAKAAAEITAQLPIYKEYPDGMKWVEFKLPEQLTEEQAKSLQKIAEGPGAKDGVSDYTALDGQGSPIRNNYTQEIVREATPAQAWLAGRLTEEGNQMGHCVGCYSKDIASGRTKIYSLRDKAGLSHVTIEVMPSDPAAIDKADFIEQIKGKQNRAPNKEYLPYVQDFVKSKDWKGVEDLRNAQMVKGPEAGKYYTYEEARQMGHLGSFEIDIPDTPEEVKLIKGLRNFMTDPGPLRRALRRVQGMAYWALQIQQLAQLNPDLQELTNFNEFNTWYNTTKSALQATPDRISKEWSDLGEANYLKVNKFLLDEFDGKQLWFELVKTTRKYQGRDISWYQFEVNAKSMEELAKRGIDITTEEGAELAKLILDIKNDLLDKTNTLEKVLQTNLAHRNTGGPDILVAMIKPLAKQFHAIRQRPFFPQGRFGRLLLIVEKKKAAGGWEVVYREAFEKRADWEAAHKIADSKKKSDERISIKELTDQQYVLMALPTDFIDMAASELDLSDEQVEQLHEILQPVNTEKALQQYDITRLGIKGYSSDALRSYANFSAHQANLLAKMEYRVKFNNTIRKIGAQLRAAQLLGPEAEKEVFRLTRVKLAMERTRDYIMSPPNEAQGLRAFVAVAYLGLNIKTALINFYGLVTTWSDITERLGLVEGSTVMARAFKHTVQSIVLTDLNARRAGNYLPADAQKALDQALEEGVLSQSYAYHLAGMANAPNLFRLPGRLMTERTGKKAVDLAMWTFRLTELGTRRVSFLSSFEQLRADGKLSFQEAYEQAVLRTNKLQNDYSAGNRVPFMRGLSIAPGNPLSKAFEPVIPLATVFLSFAQHMAFHGYGGYEIGMRRQMKLEGITPRHRMGTYTMKLLLVTLLLAGYEGLPGAENILDLIEAAWRKYGGAKPIRQMLREYVQSIEALDLDPQLAAHGFGHNLAGFDVSRSIGLGRFVPGTDVLAHPGSSTNETAGALVFDTMGASGAFLKFGLEAIFSSKPPAEVFKRLPGGLGNIYTAYEWSKNGVTTPTGSQITFDLETGKLRDLTTEEILGKALGFNPTVVSQNREKRFAQYDQQVFWQARRQRLLEDIWRAKWQKNKEAEADARKAVIDFNSGVPNEPPYRSIRITNADIALSMQARMRQKRADEQGKSIQKRYQGLYESVSQSYEKTE